MTRTFRAACWISADSQAELRLTTEEQSNLPDDELMAAALAEAKNVDLEIGNGRIVIGDWKE